MLLQRLAMSSTWHFYFSCVLSKTTIFFTLLLFSVTKWVYVLIRHSSATERLLLNACISMIVHGCPLRKNADLFCYCCYKFKVHLAIKVSKMHILKDVRLIASEKFSVKKKQTCFILNSDSRCTQCWYSLFFSISCQFRCVCVRSLCCFFSSILDFVVQ